MGGEHAEDIVVLVDGLAEVPPLLLVPPVGVGVPELPLNPGRVGVGSVLFFFWVPPVSKNSLAMLALRLAGCRDSPGGGPRPRKASGEGGTFPP